MNYLTNSQNRFKVLVSIATGRFFSVGALDDDDGSDRLTGVVSAASCVFCFLLPVVVFAFALLVVFAFAFAAFASLFFSPLRTLFLLEEELSLLESLEELLSEIFGLSSFSIPSFSSFSLSLISLFTLFSQASGMTSGWSSSIVGSVVSAISNAASISALAGFREQSLVGAVMVSTTKSLKSHWDILFGQSPYKILIPYHDLIGKTVTA